jgi:DNA mismatch repair protein MutL
MPQIRILDDRLVSQIAAGEVVERPASVVKELVENALDAGASRIEVEIEGGGARRIRLSDDGSGMSRDDALLAFDRHATSKIATFDDLERVGTLGFRGEALSSIAAVAKVDLVSAASPGDGTRVRIEGGRVVTVEPQARACGTTIEITSLFWNVPARRKFLKRRETELRHSLEAVEGYALARPEVAFSVRGDQRLLLDAPSLAGDESGRLTRIGQVYGPELAARLEEIPPEAAAELAPGVSGWVGGPETARRGRRRLVFVNRRLIRDRAVLAAFYRAVREEWRNDEFPALFLFIEVPPEQVDVNVHPQKAEVRFRDPGTVDRLSQVLRVALARARGEEPAPLRTPQSRTDVPPGWEGLGSRSDTAGEIREGAVEGGVAFGGSPPATAGLAGRIAMPALAPLERAPVPLSGRSGEVRPFRLLGQYKGSLILLEGPDGLYIVDQHVAHERILYERLRRELELERPTAQRLVEPLLLELSRAETMRLVELAQALSELGFEIEELSGGTVALSSAPASLGVEDARALAVRLASDGEATPENLVRRLLDDFAASMACRAAVKIHHPLSAEKLEALISELFRADNPYACPHGRPVVLVMTDADLERRLGRR